MTLAVMALYADGPTTCATSPAGASRRPTASPPWPPSCASSAPRSRKAPTSSRHPPPALARRRHPHLRRPPHGDVLRLAAFNPAGVHGAHRRPEVRRQDLPGLLRGPVRGGPAVRAHIPVICVDGPTASGKGTLASDVARAPGLPLPGLRRALPRRRRWPRMRAGVALDPQHEHAIARMAAALPLRFSRARCCWTART